MSKENQLIQLRENASNQLAQIRDIETGTDFLDRVKALETYAKATKQDAEMVKIIQEQKIRSMRILGKLLEQTEFDKGAAGKGNPNWLGGRKHQPPSDKPTLSDYGITKDESSTYQTIAAIPEDEFNRQMDELKNNDSSVKEITITRFKNAGKEYKRKEKIEAKKAEPIKFNKEWFVNGDSREETKKAPNGIKLIFTDPPYGMDFQSNRRVQSPKAMKIQGDGNITDAINLFEEVMVNLVPKMQNNSAALVWCSFRDERYFADSLIKLGFEIKNSIIWVRPNHGTGDLEGSFAPKHDRLLFAVKGRPKLIPRLPDVLDGSTFLKTEHPTKKPIDLIEKVINSLTMPGDLVVDPFAGSCSVGVPCVKTGREFWGCELEKLYWVEGQKNLNNI